MQNLEFRAKEFREMELRSQCLFSTREERGDEGVFFIRVRVSSSFWGSYQRRGLRGESGKFWRVRLLSIDFSVGVCFVFSVVQKLLPGWREIWGRIPIL